MSEASDEDARREVAARRAAFNSSLEAVATRVEVTAGAARGALVKVRAVTEQGRSLVGRHPLVFVAASVGVGLALGLARRRRPPAIAAPVAAARRSSLLWSVAGFVGRMALRGLVSSMTSGRPDEPPPRGRT